MKDMNFSLWWTQIRAIIRLEMSKTFFAKRGLWVYLLALAPVVPFLGHTIVEMNQRDHRSNLAAEHPVSSEALRSIEIGMTRETVEAKLGEPYAQRFFERRGKSRGFARYTDGDSDYVFNYEDDKIVGRGINDRCNIPKDSAIFATVFQFFYLRLAIFFGCVGIFMNLFRGELLDKSLHFYLLAPVRREVLLIGKYLAGLIATVIIFTTSTAIQLLTLGWHLRGPAMDEFLRGPGWHQITGYLGVTALACLGYGSVFLATGLMFRNPIIPAAVVLLWESVNIFLPVVLKKISIIFYLQSLCPVVAPPDPNMGPIWALLVSSAEAPPVLLSIGGLVLVTFIVLVIGARQARRLEINYSSD